MPVPSCSPLIMGRKQNELGLYSFIGAGLSEIGSVSGLSKHVLKLCFGPWVIPV